MSPPPGVPPSLPPRASGGNPPAAPPRRRWRVLGWTLLALLLATLLLAAGAAWWLWTSSQGWALALRQVPGLVIAGQQGRPSGGPFALQRLQWQGAGWRVEVLDLAWDDARWQGRPHPGAWLGLHLTRPRASAVRVLRPTSPQPAPSRQAPASLTLPVELSAPRLHIDSLQVDQQTPLSDITADLHLGAARGAEHRIQALRLQRDGLAISGQATLGSAGEMPLLAELAVATAADVAQAWQATLQARGPLQRLALQAQWRLGGAAPEGSAPGAPTGGQASAQASVAPFAAWPLLALSARFSELDLALLQPSWPRTWLSGHVLLPEPGSGQTADDELALDLELDNAEPGPWDAARLPLRRLQMLMHGRPAQPGTLVVERLQAELAGRQPAGELRGSGRWQGGQLALQLQLDGVQPQQLHGAAPPLTLGGPVSLQLDGLPNPAATPPLAPTPGGLSGDWQVSLNGRLPRRSLPGVTLQAQGSFAAPPDGSLRVELARALASATGNGGQASASASAERSPGGDWRLRTHGALQRFNPAPWWPAAAPGAGPHRLDGRWVADLTRPAGGTPAQPAPLLGKAGFTLDDSSRWAGQAWQGQVELSGSAQALALSASVRAGVNQGQARGSLGQGTRAGALPEGRLELQAPALAALAPLAALLPAALGSWWPREGALQASASLQGSWPALRSEGSLRVQGWRSPALSLAAADAAWQLATDAPDAPLRLQLSASGLAHGEQRLQSLQATLQGSQREHTLSLRAASPVRPPAWAEAAAAPAGRAPLAGGSALLLDGSGRWSPAAGGGGRWQGRIERLRAAPVAEPQTPWLAADALQLHLVLDAQGRPTQAGLAPGRLQALGGALAWQQAQWQAAASPGTSPRLQLRATLEPLALAPWLARWQPQFGWQGDLAVAGRVAVDNGERFDAVVVIERSGGDLSLAIEGARRALEISDLRLGLAAHQGRWQFTQALVGRSVGVVGGLQSLTISPQAAWPAPETPLTGGLSLIVPQLQVWAPWPPPGWRLGGALRIAASFGGLFAAPEYRGEISGENLSVRNLFEGVHLQQGELGVTLDGTQARIQRLAFRDGAGAGTLQVSGGAVFGQAPRAQLRAVAERLRLLDRYDRRITASGAADIGWQDGRVALKGGFTIDEGLVDATQADAPALDADVVVIHRAPLRPDGAAGKLAAAAPEARPPGAPRSPLGAADVDLRVDLGPALRLRGRGLDTLLRGQLHVTTPGGQLAVDGTVRAEQGTYTAYGQKLAIERGSLLFRGEVGNPQLDILALRGDIDTRVGVVVSGSAANPRVRLYSEPELAQMDTLTWLVLGRAPEGLGRDDTALLQRAALALLAGERGGAGAGLVQRLGLDELSLSRGGVNGATDTIISLGKQISRRVYVGYEHALGAAGGTWQLIYRVAGRLTLRARTGYENAIDAIWTWRW